MEVNIRIIDATQIVNTCKTRNTSSGNIDPPAIFMSCRWAKWTGILQSHALQRVQRKPTVFLLLWLCLTAAVFMMLSLQLLQRAGARASEDPDDEEPADLSLSPHTHCTTQNSRQASRFRGRARGEQRLDRFMVAWALYTSHIEAPQMARHVRATATRHSSPSWL